MTKTVAEKLQIKPGNEVLIGGAVPKWRALIDPLPADVSVAEGVDRATGDVAVLFATDRASLDDRLTEAQPHLGRARAVWVVYPKGNRADINRDSIWRRAEELGWTATANIAVDETWSAVRIKPTG